MSKCCHTVRPILSLSPALTFGMELISTPSQAQTGTVSVKLLLWNLYQKNISALPEASSIFMLKFVTSVSCVTERKFWTSTSVPVFQVTAQPLRTNQCKYHCPANWMGSVWSWLLVPASSLVWSCHPPLPSNITPAGTAGVQMVGFNDREWNTIKIMTQNVLSVIAFCHHFYRRYRWGCGPRGLCSGLERADLYGHGFVPVPGEAGHCPSHWCIGHCMHPICLLFNGGWAPQQGEHTYMISSLEHKSVFEIQICLACTLSIHACMTNECVQYVI